MNKIKLKIRGNNFFQSIVLSIISILTVSMKTTWSFLEVISKFVENSKEKQIVPSSVWIFRMRDI